MVAATHRMRPAKSRRATAKTRQITTVLPRRRAFKPAELLGEDDIERIHRYSMLLLRDVGLEFALPEAWDILEREGARVDRETGMVRFDPEVVRHWVAKAPPGFSIAGRNPDRNLLIGGKEIAYGSAASTPNVMDADRGRRPGNAADFRKLVKLSHALGTVDFFSGYPTEPSDLPVNTRHLDCNYDLLTLSDRVIRLYAIGRTRIDDGLEMVAIAHGISRDQLMTAPRTITVLNVNSPLKVDASLLSGAMEMARNGQAVIVTPVAFAGAMSPITLSGSLVQHNAECLGVIAFLQMVNPGAPVLYGSIVTNIDMKSGAPAFGTPETVTGAIATGQLARHYGLPTRLFGACSSNAVDAQAAYETLFTLWACNLAGVSLAFHSHGYLETGLITSFEKAILDSDLVGMMKALARPIELSDGEEVLAAIRNVGPGGHFLASEHTLARYETAFHSPLLSDWRDYDAWLADGGQDYAQRANKKWKDLLNAYERPAMNAGTEEALGEFVSQRKQEIGAADI